MNPVELLFMECERARSAGDLIQKVSKSDKEFHFQNWVQDRLVACDLSHDDVGRNTYPDFRLVEHQMGFEVKGLAWPGREANYDSNSQVPSGSHRNRSIFYVFGRYPNEVAGMEAYPVVDLVICHGSFLNCDNDYRHKNDSFRGFGSYGDILIRDRKMYVVPTPFWLVEGTAGLGTLIVPSSESITSSDLVRVGEFTRREVDNVVTSYEFNLKTNKLVKNLSPNPTAGREHAFTAYRLAGHGDDKTVRLSNGAERYAESMNQLQ